MKERTLIFLFNICSSHYVYYFVVSRQCLHVEVLCHQNPKSVFLVQLEMTGVLTNIRNSWNWAQTGELFDEKIWI